MKLISYRDVEIKQEDYEILQNINFTVNKGDFVYLIGKVGSGKSSLLKTIYGEIPILKGEAMVFDTNIIKLKAKHTPLLRKKIGIIFQDFQLLTDRNVEENLQFVLKSTGWKKKEEISHKINEVLDLVEMKDKKLNFPHELSGGEKQRIAIARAILNTPQLILADEPTANLDTETGEKIMQLLQNICLTGTAIVLTTHNLTYLNKYPGIVYLCENKQLKEITQENEPNL